MSIITAVFRSLPVTVLFGAGFATVTSAPDPGQIAAKAEVASGRYEMTGTGECVHSADVTIFEKPAAMWHATVTHPSNPLSQVIVTLWQPQGSSRMEVSLSLQAALNEYDLSTVEGAEIRGSAVARVEPRGAGATLLIDGRTGSGHPITVSVACPAFGEPEANG